MNFLNVFVHHFQFTTTAVIVGTVFAIAIFSFLMAKLKWFRKEELCEKGLYRQKILIGAIFGLIAVGTDVVSTLNNPNLYQKEHFDIIVSIADAPSIVASFCFCPLSGIVAGVITTVERAILSFCDFETVAWYFSAGITLLIALYGAALRQWVFNNEQPLVFTGAIAASFAEILRFGSLIFLLPYVTRFDEGRTEIYRETLSEYLNGIYPLDKVQSFLENNGSGLSEADFRKIEKDADAFVDVFQNGLAETQCLDLISHYLPYMLIGVALAAALAVAVSYPWKREDRRLISIRIPVFCAFLLFGLGLFFVMAFSLNNAYRLSKQTMLDSYQAIYKKLPDRVSFFMHSSAVAMKRQGYFRTLDGLTNEKLEEYKTEYNVDEISVFKRNGKFVASSSYKRLKPGVNNISDISLWARFKNIYEQDVNVHFGMDGKFMYDVFDNEKKSDKLIDANEKTYKSCMALTFTTDAGEDCILILGYTWEHMESDCFAFLEPMLRDMRVGKSGCVIAVSETVDGKGNSSAKMVFPPYGYPEATGKTVDEIGMSSDQWRCQSDVKFQDAKICGRWYFVFPIMEEPVKTKDKGDLHFAIILPYAEHYFTAVQQISAAGLTLFFACILFNVMKIRSAKKQEEIDKLRKADMKIAFQIQDAELQDDWIDDGKPCKIISTMTPAKEVGGDFYDYYSLPDGRVAVTIADVSGKGVPAAIFMMKAKFTLKTCVLSEADLPSAVNQANQLLCEHNDAQMFVTVWTGIFNPGNRQLEFISAGHNPPLIKHSNGNVEWLRGSLRKKPPLATFGKVCYLSETIQLEAGDRLFLYTDGVTEATNGKKELYGEEKLKETLQGAPVGSVLNKVVDDSIRKFQGESEQADDITMLSMLCKPESR